MNYRLNLSHRSDPVDVLVVDKERDGYNSSGYSVSDGSSSPPWSNVGAQDEASDPNYQQWSDVETQNQTSSYYYGDSASHPRPVTRYKSTVRQLEAAGLSKTYPLPRVSSQADTKQEDPATIDATWDNAMATWSDGSLSMRVVLASEYHLMKDGSEKIKLMCPARTDLIPTKSSAVQMKWM